MTGYAEHAMTNCVKVYDHNAPYLSFVVMELLFVKFDANSKRGRRRD